jgi:hypothetical protein
VCAYDRNREPIQQLASRLIGAAAAEDEVLITPSVVPALRATA